MVLQFLIEQLVGQFVEIGDDVVFQLEVELRRDAFRPGWNLFEVVHVDVVELLLKLVVGRVVDVDDGGCERTKVD